MRAWQATVQDEAGNAVFNPVITVYREDGSTLADIFNEDGTSKENPFIGTTEGFAQFWADRGTYRVVGANGGVSETWQVDLADEEAILLAQEAKDGVESFKLPEGIVVRIPTDFLTIQDALDQNYDKFVGANQHITILIESGHELTHGWTLNGGDYSHYIIAAEDGTVQTVASGFEPVPHTNPGGSWAIAYYENCRAPRLSCVIRGRGTNAYDGIMCHHGVDITIDAGCGVENCRNNFEMRMGGCLTANGATFRDARYNNLRITNGVLASISGADCSGGMTEWTPERGYTEANVHISRGTMAQAQGLIIDGAGCYAVTVRRSFASLLEGVYSNLGTLAGGGSSRAIMPMYGAHIVGHGITVDGSPLGQSNMSASAPALNMSGGQGYISSGNVPLDFGVGHLGDNLPVVSSSEDQQHAGFYRYEAGSDWGPTTQGGGALRLDRLTDRGTWVAGSNGGSSGDNEPRLFVKGTSGAAGDYGPWRELYHRGNLIGTVTREGGMPTGPVLERGNTADGHWIRFADGTQICWRNYGTPATATFNEFLDFPVPFVGNPSGSISAAPSVLSGTGTGDRQQRFHAMILAVSDTQWNVRISQAVIDMHASFTASEETIAVRLMAVGRWA